MKKLMISSILFLFSFQAHSFFGFGQKDDQEQAQQYEAWTNEIIKGHPDGAYTLAEGSSSGSNWLDADRCGVKVILNIGQGDVILSIFQDGLYGVHNSGTLNVNNNSYPLKKRRVGDRSDGISSEVKIEGLKLTVLEHGSAISTSFEHCSYKNADNLHPSAGVVKDECAQVPFNREAYTGVRMSLDFSRDNGFILKHKGKICIYQKASE